MLTFIYILNPFVPTNMWTIKIWIRFLQLDPVIKYIKYSPILKLNMKEFIMYVDILINV